MTDLVVNYEFEQLRCLLPYPPHEVWSRSLFKVFLKLDGVSALSVDLNLLLMIVGLVSVEQLSFWGV